MEEDELDELEEVQYPDDFTFDVPETQTVSRLLTIDPELRNRIYEFVFEGPSKGLVQDLLMATPPSKSILFACRQVNSEAKGLYKTGYQHYWTQTHFVLNDKYRFFAKSITLSMSSTAEDLAHVKHLRHVAPIARRMASGTAGNEGALHTSLLSAIQNDPAKALSALLCNVTLKARAT
ncbi:hypothetical protein LTR56_004665 [Elasticomyces elasticus]|nr:hypothetical protein LTR22_019906 [Elasticomyces elasticus]KAK3653461.1 hypothetical protein LTR56_004665 [Elasticomyces elasticus]KAK4926005.1 hypothetical protein LTR49_007143 [Elasticomyces elasticus]KAK5768241.1 hypothetical protein LTS12_001725 [Elasticomyces elasticus]